MDELFDGAGYTLNYEEIAKSKDMMAMTRLLAIDLMRDGYIKVGDYIQGLADSDLNSIIQAMDRQDDGQYNDLILVSEMLATGEGCDPSKSLEDFSERMNQLTTLLVIESLGRKGLVKVFHENMSFHPDMKDKMIVEKV